MHLAIAQRDGEPTLLKLGDGYRVRPSSGLRARARTTCSGGRDRGLAA